MTYCHGSNANIRNAGVSVQHLVRSIIVEIKLKNDYTAALNHISLNRCTTQVLRSTLVHVFKYFCKLYYYTM